MIDGIRILFFAGGTRLIGRRHWTSYRRALLAMPDCSTLIGKRDYALLVGCVSRRSELASLTIKDIQMRENRRAISNLRGKRGRIRIIAVPAWVKHGINA